MAESIETCLDGLNRDFVADYGSHGLLEQIRLFITKQIRRQKKRLEAGG